MLKLIIVLLSSVYVRPDDVVITAQGQLRGISHGAYIAYTGVPYATDSENNRRFKKASLAPFWQGIRESYQPHCTPSDVEECMRLDVYVPSEAASQNMPVMVWVTGGSGLYHPGKLVQQGIIVVIVYHRLAPIGFLCMNEEKIPGNAGAKDVVLALRWVRDNIIAFRGNHAHVVVAGQSFGAAITEALLMSPMSQGLYHGVILQSGTVLSPWAFNYDAENRALALANTFDGDDAVSILLNANPADLVAKSNELDVPYFPFGMCVEKAFKNEERLITEAPFHLLTTKTVNSVPMIIGYNSDEAYIFASNLKEADVLSKISGDLVFLLPEELKFLSERELALVVRQINEMYFAKNVSMASVFAYHRDAYFVNHIHRSVKLHASTSNLPVYFYQFSYNSDPGIAQEPGIKKRGAAHSDELAYMFPEEGRDLEGDDGIVQERLIKLWTNFVKYLNPSPGEGELKWEPVTAQNPRVLTIDSELEMQDFPYKRAMLMWDDIYEKYYYSRH